MTVNDHALYEIARMAYGSGSSEKTNGGRGFMGVIKDAQGRSRIIKYDTHRFQATSADEDDLSQRTAAQQLRNILVDIAKNKNVPSHQIDRIREELGINDGDADDDPPYELLSRKVVASVVKMIDKDVWKNAIQDDKIKSYSSKNDNTLFSTVTRNDGVEKNNSVRRFEDQRSFKQCEDIGNGIKCLKELLGKGNLPQAKSYFAKMVPVEARKLHYEVNPALGILNTTMQQDEEEIDSALKTLADVFGFTAKQKDALKAAVVKAQAKKTDVTEAEKILKEAFRPIDKALKDKWDEVNERYEDSYREMGLVTPKSSRKRIEDLSICRVAIKNGAVDARMPSADKLNEIVTSDNPVETLLTDFGCRLEDLKDLQDLGEAYVKANAKFEKVVDAVRAKLNEAGGVTSQEIDSKCQALRNAFEERLTSTDSKTGDKSMVSTSSINQFADDDLSVLPDLIKNNLSPDALLKLAPEQLLSQGSELKQAMEAEATSRGKTASFVKARGELLERFDGFGDELGKKLKSRIVNQKSDASEITVEDIDRQIEVFKAAFKRWLDTDDTSFGGGLILHIPAIFEELGELTPDQFCSFTEADFSSGNDVGIRDRVRAFRNDNNARNEALAFVPQMEKQLDQVGANLKAKLGGLPQNVSDVSETRVDERIAALKNSLGKMLREGPFKGKVEDTLRQIPELSVADFCRLTAEELLQLETDKVKNRLEQLKTDDKLAEARATFSKMSDSLAESLAGFGPEIEARLGKTPPELLGESGGQEVKAKIAGLLEAFKKELAGDGSVSSADKMHERFERISARIRTLREIPVAAFTWLSVEDLAGAGTKAFESFVVAGNLREKLEVLKSRLIKNEASGMKLPIEQRIRELVSALADRLANGQITVYNAETAVGTIALLPASAITRFSGDELLSIRTNPETKAKVADFLRADIFGSADRLSRRLIIEHGGAEIFALVNTGTMGAKGDGSRWGVVLKGLASAVNDSCSGMDSRSAVRFAVNHYTAFSKSLLDELSANYYNYQSLLEKLDKQIENDPSVSTARLVKTVWDSMQKEGLPRTIGNELVDVIWLVTTMYKERAPGEEIDLDGAVRAVGYDPDPAATQKAVNDTREAGLSELDELRNRFLNNAGGSSDRDAVENAAKLLRTAIAGENSLETLSAFMDVIKQLGGLTPYEFASLREVDLQAARQGGFKLENLRTRAVNLRKTDDFKQVVKSAVDKLSDRLRTEAESSGREFSKYETSIGILRKRLEFRLTSNEDFAEDADVLIKNSSRDLETLESLELGSFIRYDQSSGKELSTLFSRLDDLGSLGDQLDEIADKVKTGSPNLDKKVDDRIAKVRRYLATCGLWNVSGVCGEAWGTGLVDSLVKGNVVQMSDQEFSAVLSSLEKIHGWRVLEMEIRGDSSAVNVGGAARHYETELLEGRITPDEVNHRMDVLMGLPKGNVGELRNNALVIYGNYTQIARAAFGGLARLTTDDAVRARIASYTKECEDLLYDQFDFVRANVAKMIEVFNDRLEKGRPVSYILKSETLDQLRQTVLDFTAVGDVFDWLDERLRDELAAAPVKGVSADAIKNVFSALKTSVVDALYSGDETLASVNTLLNGILDSPLSAFVKSGLLGKNQPVTLESFKKACGKIVSATKPPKKKTGESPLNNLSLAIQKALPGENAVDAFLYAVKQYEDWSPYLKNQATPSERVRLREFARDVYASRDEPRIENGFYFLKKEFGGRMSRCFLPCGTKCDDFDVWSSEEHKFAYGERIVQDIYDTVFVGVENSLDGGHANVKKI